MNDRSTMNDRPTVSKPSRSLALALVVLCGLSMPDAIVRAQSAAVPISLRVDDETAPPRGTVQLKLRVTDPTPITTGFADFLDFGEGIGLGTVDAAGVAIGRAGRLRLRFVFPTDPSPALFAEYPLVTITGPVPATATAGTVLPLSIDPASLNLVNAGLPYTFELQQGTLSIVASALSIDRVEPGSADLNAGDTVHIYGRNFTPNTRVDLNETAVRRVRFVDSEHLAVVLAEPARMHGKRIRLRNREKPTRSRVTYYSYQRTRNGAPSSDPLLALAHPVFPLAQSATVSLTLPASSPGLVYGVALQNIGATPVRARVALTDTQGGPRGSAHVVVGSNERIVRGTTELFGHACTDGCRLTVSGSGVLQVIGIAADPSTDSAAPIVLD